LCEDRVTLPVAGGGSVPEQSSPIQPTWQRWNDYGIGCLLEGGAGLKRGDLRQAEESFGMLLTLGIPEAVWHGHVNRARVLIEEGRLREAPEALEQARKAASLAPWWTLAWFNGVVNTENATEKEHFDAAIADFERIVDPRNQPHDRKFDFTRDYVVLDKLGNTLFKRSQLEADDPATERQFLERAVTAFERALAIDPEDLDAHFGLSQCYARLGREALRTKSAVGATDDPTWVAELAGIITDPKAPLAERSQAMTGLNTVLGIWEREPTTPERPKLPRIQALMVRLRPAFHAEADPQARAALARVLGELHRLAHTIYRPDDLARNLTTRLYRAKHPAANSAAEAIVIYETRRP
jgi:tetratricopeptide (TPR) repeat protein